MKKLICLLVLSSCMVGPDFQTPDTCVQQQWMECQNTHVTCNDSFAREWWNYFGDETLNCLVEIAHNQNLTLKEAGMRVLEGRALLGIAEGEFFPQLQQLTGSAQRIKGSENAPNSFGADLNFWDFISGLQVAWELDFWGRFRRGIESAEEGLFASVANLQDVLVLLLSDVATTYVNIRTLESRAEIVHNNVAIQQRSLEIVQARFNAGAVTDLDVQQAKTLLYNSRSRLPVIYNDLRQAKNAMAVLLGMLPDQMDDLIPPSTHIPIAPSSIAVGIPTELLCRRPDVRRALHTAAAQSAQIGVAVSDLLPRLSLTGFIGFESSADTTSTQSGGGGHFFDMGSLTYTVGPAFAWPILNYGRLLNNVRAKYARFYQTVLAYQNQVLFAYKEVEDGLSSFIRAHDEVVEVEKSVKAAERATEVARRQYVEGIADYTRVLDTERSRLLEEERLAIARGRIALGLVTTYKALGGGWEPCFCP